MMNIFNTASDQTQEFKDFCKCKHSDNTQKVTRSKTKVAPYELLINELFYTQEKTNKKQCDYGKHCNKITGCIFEGTLGS